MAKPTITYGHGFLDDCEDTSDWSTVGVVGINPGDYSIAAEHDDIFKISALADGSGDEYVYYERDITNISSAVYTKFLIRWKTSAASNGFGARVELVFTDGSTQFVLGSSAPQFSITWNVTSGTITSGKTIDKVRLYADDYPDSLASGTHYVYYDFILLCEGIFSFPYVHSIDPLHLSDRYADLAIPGRVGDIQQYLGMKSPLIKLSGDMEEGTWGGSKIEFGEFLYRIFHENYNDPWQWFTSDLINCKVTPRDFYISQKRDSNAHRVWNLVLAMYSASSGAESTWNSLQWLGF